MTTDRFCITQVAATVDALLGAPRHSGMAAPLLPVLQQAARSFSGPYDRVFLYNPDAIGPSLLLWKSGQIWDWACSLSIRR